MSRILLILCIGLLSPAIAQEAAKLEVLVGQLGDDDFKVRQKASNELMQRVEKDPHYAKELARFAKHNDPEVRARIAELTKDLPVILEWINPANEKGMKSVRGSFNPMTLIVKNRSEIEVTCYWIDFQGIRQPRRRVKPGEQIVFTSTYESHPWLLTDVQGKGLGIYVPVENKKREIKEVQIIYTGKEADEAKK